MKKKPQRKIYIREIPVGYSANKKKQATELIISNLKLPPFKGRVMEVKITIKCVSCGARKEVGEEQMDTPFCDVCFSPMVTEKVSYKK